MRIESQPFRPGCNYATLMHLIERGTVRADTAVRGPTTKQFWMLARWCPGVAHRLGICHSCQAKVDPESRDCTSCGAEFGKFEDRQALGLGEVRPLPGRTAPAARRQTGSDQPAPATPLDQRDSMARAGDADGVSPTDRIEISEDLGDEGIRELRLRRDLRRSKRWTAVWSVLALVTLTGLGGYVVFQQLDLGSGPVGRWLAAREAKAVSGQVGVVTGPDAGDSSPVAAEGADDPAALDAVGDGVVPSLESADGAEVLEPAGGAEAGEEPGQGEAAGPRVRALSRLRGLR